MTIEGYTDLSHLKIVETGIRMREEEKHEDAVKTFSNTRRIEFLEARYMALQAQTDLIMSVLRQTAPTSHVVARLEKEITERR